MIIFMRYSMICPYYVGGGLMHYRMPARYNFTPNFTYN